MRFKDLIVLKVSIACTLLLFTSSCMSAKHIKAQEIQTDLALRQMHSEIEEQKYKLNRLEVELQIVEGKADSQSNVTQEILKEVAKLSQEESHLVDTTLSELEKKIEQLDEKENELFNLVKALKAQSESNLSCLKQHKKQLDQADQQLFDQMQSMESLQTHLKALILTIDQEELGQLFYVVQKGDTLTHIANENEVSIEAIMQMNELGSNQLVVGQKLRLK